MKLVSIKDKDVENLNLWGKGLTDVAALKDLKKLKVLSLSLNRIETLDAISHCTKLEELYLRRNQIKDLTQLDKLKTLKRLRILWLMENPICDEKDYVETVLEALPWLQKLDNIDVSKLKADCMNNKFDNDRPHQCVVIDDDSIEDIVMASPRAEWQRDERIKSFIRAASPFRHEPEIISLPRSELNIYTAIVHLLNELDQEALIALRFEIQKRITNQL